MSDKSYTGVDNLEVMTEAVNYNNHIVGLIRRYAADSEFIVDFGAGMGTFAMALRGLGAEILCIEPDEELSAEISKHGLVVHAELHALADESVDFIYSLNVLEHIENDGAVLDLFAQKLRPGGRILIYVPAHEALFSSMDRKVGHFRRYSRAALRKLAEESGFVLDTIKYVDSLGFFASMAYKLLDDGSGSINRGGLIVYDRYVFPISRLLDKAMSRFFGKNLLLVAEKTR